MEDYYLVDAKQEYTSYLIYTIAPSMYTGFKDIFQQSKHLTNGNSVFKNFQLLLNNVPQWNHYLLEKEVADITKETGCDWLDNLITAVFVSHSKILTSVKVGNYKPRNKKIDLKIPDTTSFIHQCYIQAAREFYKNPMLFLDDPKHIRPDEILKNQRSIDSIIKESITSTIRKLLPFRNILNEYLSLQEGVNTIYIGNSSMGPSMGGSIMQPTAVQQILPPPVKIESESVVSKQVQVQPIVNGKQKEESVSEEEEMEVRGKELDLMMVQKKPNNISKPIPKAIPKLINKRMPVIEQSVDSEMVNNVVEDLKEEFEGKDQSSLDLDDLSFLQPHKAKEKDIRETLKKNDFEKKEPIQED